MRDEAERKKLYKLEESIVNIGSEEYYNIISKKEPKAILTEYIPYVIARRVHSFRNGMYPATREIKLKEISEPWIKKFKKIRNNKY